MDIFEKDVILIPVNHDNSHWTAAAINFRQKRIESYDSMDLDRSLVYKVSCVHTIRNRVLTSFLQLLRGYLDAEHRNKKKKPFDFTGWEDRLYEVRVLYTCFTFKIFICSTGYPTAGERLRLRCFHMPIS